jgi:competence protein ComEA
MPDIIVARTWRDKLEALAGRRREGILLALVVVGAVLVGVGSWMRGAPATVAPPAVAPKGATGGGAGPAAGRGARAAEIFVHVAGAVRRPGLYRMPDDARVADAVRAAGGPRPRADLDALNLAEPLVDGAKVDVVGRGQSLPSSGVAPAPSGASPSAVVHLNTADQAALESIPEVGPVTALAILEYRTEIGAFTSVDQLLEVSGIGPATLEAIRPYVTL